MRPKNFAILAGIHPSRVSRLAKACRFLQNPRNRDVLTEHPLTRGYLLSRMSVMRAEMMGLVTPPPGWQLTVAVIDGKRRAVCAWPDIPNGGAYTQWFANAVLDGKAMTATIGGQSYPVTIETGDK